jgi:hypothetical protein
MPSRLTHDITLVQRPVALPACGWHEIDDRLHALGRDQRSGTAGMSAGRRACADFFGDAPGSVVARRDYPTTVASTSSSNSVTQGQLPFEVSDPFLLLGDLSRMFSVSWRRRSFSCRSRSSSFVVSGSCQLTEKPDCYLRPHTRGGPELPVHEPADPEGEAVRLGVDRRRHEPDTGHDEQVTTR